MGIESMIKIKNSVVLGLILLSCSPTIAHDGGSRALQPYSAPAVPPATAWARERLVQFMRDLTYFVYAHHVITNTARQTFGMTYEFYRDGKQIQEFGLDTMHDGAWFMEAMIEAHRADPTGPYLALARRYQIPFYLNLLHHSDRLFPKMKPGPEDKLPFSSPIKGWIPRGWDDGGGYELATGRPHPKGYFTSSNHLMQVVANSLLNVWLTTRDPKVAEALRYIAEYKRNHFGPITVIEFAEAVANAQTEKLERYRFDGFNLNRIRPYYTGLYQQQSHTLGTYNDPLAWQFQQAVTLASLRSQIDPQFVVHATIDVLGNAQCMELYFDDVPYRYGLYFFEIQDVPYFTKNGKLSEYHSTGKKLLGGRGIQFSAIKAGLLPFLNVLPAPIHPYVALVDVPPETDSICDSIYRESFSLTNANTIVRLLSDPKNLHMYIESYEKEVSCVFEPADPVKEGQPGKGQLTITANGNIKTDLLHVFAWSKGDPWRAELRIPYTVIPAQKPWINGVEYGRYRLTINGRATQHFTIRSHPDRLRRRLEEAVLGTIETWHDVWNHLGFIPSGYRGAHFKAHRWEISDVGNYAHLIMTIARWLIYQQGESVAALIKKQIPEKPVPAYPLPQEVLKAQGLL